MSSDLSTGVPTPAERTRPGAVTAAGALLYATAAIIIVQILLTLSVMSKELTAIREAYQNVANGDTLITITRASLIGGLIVDVAVAVAFAIFAYFNMQGRNGIRIATWVVGGLAVLCFGCGSVSGGLSSRFTSSSNQSPELKAAADHLRNAIPHWYTSAAAGLDVVLFIAMVLVIILLAVPASNAYFRKPPVAMIPYPTYPTYPSAG
jgi:hypothetical protein